MTPCGLLAPPAAGREASDAWLPIVSRELVRSYKHLYGRGPTKAKTIHRDDAVLTVLEDSFTRWEQLLVDAGLFDRVRDYRQACRDEVKGSYEDLVECMTERAVRSSLGQIDRCGVAFELFLLDPVSDVAPVERPPGRGAVRVGVSDHGLAVDAS